MQVVKNINKFIAIVCFTLLTNVVLSQDSKPLHSKSEQAFPNLRISQSNIRAFTFDNTQMSIPSALSNWGYMCKAEFKLEQKIRLPLKFRLGNLDYVNALEGKYGYNLLQLK